MHETLPPLDGGLVNVDETARLVLAVGVGPRLVPLDGRGGGARDRRAAGDGRLDAVAVVVVGEVRVEDGAEVARLLVLRSVEREPDPGTRRS